MQRIAILKVMTMTDEKTKKKAMEAAVDCYGIFISQRIIKFIADELTCCSIKSFSVMEREFWKGV